MKKWTLHRIHKWLGLFAALWLAVLGITGLLLDHRDTWTWLWQSGLSQTVLPENIRERARVAPLRIYQVNPQRADCHITGGQHGTWTSQDGGKTWHRTDFVESSDQPQMYAAQFIGQDSSMLWLATGSGLWRSDDCGVTAFPAALPGLRVTDLTRGDNASGLLGVVDRSRLFRFDTTGDHIVWLDPVAPDRQQLPASITLSRFVRDLHYGRGVFTAPLSLWWSDAAGLAMLLIPLSGLLFFLLPKYWRRKKQQGITVSRQRKKQTIRWLFRVHAPLLGLVTFIPVLYLSVTGIFLDHNDALIGWMKQTTISRAWQPPVYSLRSLEQEIYSITAYPGREQQLGIGTRLGMFTSRDNGETWQRECFPGGRSWFVWSLTRSDTGLFVGGMGGPNLYRENPEAEWQIVRGAGHMPSDAVWLDGQTWLILNRDGLRKGAIGGSFELVPPLFPELEYIPWYYIIDGLHSGILIHKQWKWVNDLFAILAIILVVTGLMRWWRKKWI